MSTVNLTVTGQAEEPPVSLDPYAAAQAVWNNRFTHDARQLLLWQVVAVGCVAAAGISAWHAKTVSAQHQVQTIIAKVDRNDMLLESWAATPEVVTVPRETLVRGQLLQWLDDIRGLTGDRMDKELDYKRANAKMTAGVHAEVQRYFGETKPEVRLLTSSVSVTEATALPQESKTWHLEWKETERDLKTNTVNSVTTWRAILTVELQLSQDATVRVDNPMGVVITGLSWTQTGKGEKE